MAESQDKTVGESFSQNPGYTPDKDQQSQAVEDTVHPDASFSPPQDVVELCRETFQKTAEYLRGELDGTIEDYKLLEKMNQLTTGKYSEMKHIALSISGALNDLSDKYKSLQPYLEQIDQIEESVTVLEQAAYSLDQYSKRLGLKKRFLPRAFVYAAYNVVFITCVENKFRSLEKR